MSQQQPDTTIDGLTGLYDHRTFQKMLAVEIAKAEREKLPLTMLMCDIDQLKYVNEAFSHRAGDKVIKFVATILNESATRREYFATLPADDPRVRIIRGLERMEDLAFRYGGDEFIVLLP